jgi:hypothetical protein
MRPHAQPEATGSGASLSHVLGRLAGDTSRSRISIGDLLVALQDRAIGALIFVFAFPNVMPMPPGVSSVLGAPLLFLTTQLALGLKPWLPKVIAGRSMDRRHLVIIVGRIAPWLARTERLLRPRMSMLSRPPFEYAIGCICLLLAIILFLPIPMGNMPPAFTICLFSLAILERDGLWILIGLCSAAASIALAWGVLFALFHSALLLLHRLIS